jgi:hypothetical protein
MFGEKGGKAYCTRALFGAVGRHKLAIEHHQEHCCKVNRLEDGEGHARDAARAIKKGRHTKNECSALEMVTLLERLGVMSISCPEVC